MKRFVLAIALTGLMSVPVFAGNIPTNGAVGEVPTNGATAPPPTTTTSSALLTNVVLTIINLIVR